MRHRQPWAGPPSSSPSTRSTAGFVLRLNFRICPRCAAGEVPRGTSQKVWVRTAEPAAGSGRRVAIPSLRKSEGNCHQPGPRRPLGETGSRISSLRPTYLHGKAPTAAGHTRSSLSGKVPFLTRSSGPSATGPSAEDESTLQQQGCEKGRGREQLCGPLRASLSVPTGGRGWGRPLGSTAACLFCVVNSRPGGSDGF